MSTQTINIAIENLFSNAWGATTPIRFDNVSFTLPSNATSWVSIEVWDGASIKSSIGTGAQLRRASGTVFVDIYVPVGNGSKLARQYADQVCSIFRDVQVSDITFEEPDVLRIGEKIYSGTGAVQGTSQWYQMKVAIPYIANVYI